MKKTDDIPTELDKSIFGGSATVKVDVNSTAANVTVNSTGDA
jgi:hypothetical protein